MKARRLWIIGSSVLISLTACHREKSDNSRLESFPVRVEAVAKMNLEETITLVGTIKARDEATLFSRVPGKLLRNLVKEGDRIGKNQAVALVERDEVGVKFEPAPVPSTLTGVVARVYLDRGANVTLSTPVALVVDQGQMQVRAEIPERYAGKVSLGKDVRVKVDAHADKTFEGKISRLSPVVDTSTRTTYMEAALENPAGLLQSGMFAKLNVVIAKKNGALAVPLDSVIETNDAVFVAENGIARRRPVELGLRTENHAEVIKGLNEGEAVVTFGLFGLKDGSPVEILK